MIRRLTLFSLAAFGLCIPVYAASFDCSHAASAMEKTICGNANLSKVDEALANAYEAALKPLSPEGQAVTRAGEKAWLGFARKVCHLDGTAFPDEKEYNNSATCLTGLYQERIKALGSASPKAGPYQFYSQTEFRASAAKPDANINYDETTEVLSTYQIDLPTSDNEKAWNVYIADLIKKRIGTDCDSGSYNHEVSSKIEGAFLTAISITISDSEYCGGAHPMWSGVPNTRLLEQKRNLIEADIFKGTPADWQPFLKQAIFDALQAHYREYNPGQTNTPMGIKSVDGLQLPDADHWTLQPKGLGIQFGQYQLGGYPSGAPQVVIPWEKLKPYLNPDSPIRLPPQ